jgi:hypothetical protein
MIKQMFVCVYTFHFNIVCLVSKFCHEHILLYDYGNVLCSQKYYFVVQSILFLFKILITFVFMPFSKTEIKRFIKRCVFKFVS